MTFTVEIDIKSPLLVKLSRNKTSNLPISAQKKSSLNDIYVFYRLSKQLLTRHRLWSISTINKTVNFSPSMRSYYGNPTSLCKLHQAGCHGRYYTNMTSLWGDNPLEGKLFLVETPQGCRICFIMPNKIQNTKGEKLQTPEILDKYLSSVLLN